LGYDYNTLRVLTKNVCRALSTECSRWLEYPEGKIPIGIGGRENIKQVLDLCHELSLGIELKVRMQISSFESHGKQTALPP